MKIPLVDLASQSARLCDDILPAIENVIRKANYILGEEVEIFEEEFAQYCEARHCVGVSSGTEALHLALRAFDIGPGDEVITAANTFAASALAIAYVGAQPVVVDINPTDYNLDANWLEAAITPRTKAIMPVHLFGQSADMDGVKEIAQRHGLRVIEDASQAHGARYHGRRVGTLGDAGCFSFYPGKNLGAFGDGGAVVTDDDALAAKLRQLRNYGQSAKNVHACLGFNARLDTLQAAVLLVKLAQLENWNQQRRHNAGQYNDVLAETELELPVENAECLHVYHLYVAQHAHRDDLLAHLEREGVSCGIHYPRPIHQALPFLQARTVPDGVPVATEVANRILSLPMFPELTPEQIQKVASAVTDFAVTAVGR